jgi:phosphate starvation-inducible PhoH-like protein
LSTISATNSAKKQTDKTAKTTSKKITRPGKPGDDASGDNDSKRQGVSFTLEPENNERLSNLGGQFEQHLRQIETHFDVEISNRGFDFKVKGLPSPTQQTINLLQNLYEATLSETLSPEKIHLALQDQSTRDAPAKETSATIKTKRKLIRARGPNQSHYIRSIQTHDLSFGIGPAGTGKTYLAVACAVEAFEHDEVRRIILVRPAVEAGEKLGFLPGDLSQKVDPYLRPMYDALYEMLGFEKVDKLIEKNVIEVAPLAYMRGRTLNDSFIIMDEAQNTTVEQMKMFLTRIGFGSTAVVTGDITQIDLPKNQQSGLKHVIGILQGVKEIRFSFFQPKDVVRHNLVKKIVEAYEQFDTAENDSKTEKNRDTQE